MPFVGIGLLLLVFWLGALAAPLFFEGWRLGPDGLAARSALAGLRTRRFEPADVAWVELRRFDPARSRGVEIEGESDDRPCSLVLGGCDGEPLLRLDGLIEAEARHAGAALCDRLRPHRKAAPAAPTLWDRQLDG